MVQPRKGRHFCTPQHGAVPWSWRCGVGAGCAGGLWGHGSPPPGHAVLCQQCVLWEKNPAYAWSPPCLPCCPVPQQHAAFLLASLQLLAAPGKASWPIFWPPHSRSAPLVGGLWGGSDVWGVQAGSCCPRHGRCRQPAAPALPGLWLQRAGPGSCSCRCPGPGGEAAAEPQHPIPAPGGVGGGLRAVSFPLLCTRFCPAPLSAGWARCLSPGTPAARPTGDPSCRAGRVRWQLRLALQLPAESSAFWRELCTLQPGSLSLAVASCRQNALCVLAGRRWQAGPSAWCVSPRAAPAWGTRPQVLFRGCLKGCGGFNISAE